MVTIQEQLPVLVRIGRNLNHGIVFPGEKDPVDFNEFPLTHKDIDEYEETGHRGLRVVLMGNGFCSVGTVVRAQNDWLEFTSEARHLYVKPDFDVTNMAGLDDLRYIKNGIGLEFKLPDTERLAEIALTGSETVTLGHGEFILYEVLTTREIARKLLMRLAGDATK